MSRRSSTCGPVRPPGRRRRNGGRSAMNSDRWQAYVQALNAVHSERDQAGAAGRLDLRARSDRAATLDSYGSRLTAQREALAELSGRLRAPLQAQDAAPGPVAPLSWELG